ncbi:hypothetical protein AB8O64_36180 (plasmid) [Streptomyces sp. QH1-20]
MLVLCEPLTTPLKALIIAKDAATRVHVLKVDPRAPDQYTRPA